MNNEAQSSFTPTVLVVEHDDDRRARMNDTAYAQGFSVEAVASQREALTRLRRTVPDVLWAGPELSGTGLADFFDVLAAAYPTMPRLATVSAADWETGMEVLEAGAFDVMRDEDDVRVHEGALRRALVDARARHHVQEERGKLLGAQSRLTAVGPAVEKMLGGLTEALQESIDRPDISLRQVETVCAQALSAFLDGGHVVMMAYERKSHVLRPRGTSHACPEHETAADRGFSLAASNADYRETLDNITADERLTRFIRDTYAHKQCYVAPLGPFDDPYGVVAFMTDHASPPTPDEEEFLAQLACNAGHCLRVARHFRALLRRGALGTLP